MVSGCAEKQNISVACPMRPPVSASIETAIPKLPTLFQIAAFFEELFPSAAQTAEDLEHLPFATWELNPRDLLKELPIDKKALSSVLAKKPRSIKKVGLKPNGEPKKTGLGKDAGLAILADIDGNGGRADFVNLPRKVSFSFECRVADSVKLVGDFTGWETRPIEMMHSADGFWFTVVPLPPGSYQYQFLADGQWRNDPQASRQARNTFGTVNSVIDVH